MKALPGFRLLPGLLTLLLGLWQPLPGAAKELTDAPEPPADLPPKLHPIPRLERPPYQPLTAEEQQNIEDLIQRLALIDKPDYGMSSTLAGTGFAPQPGAARHSYMLLTDHQLATANAFIGLVRMGPRALPALLKHLDDATPTKLVMKHDGVSSGGMFYGKEVGGNPAVPAQVKAAALVWGDKEPGDPEDAEGAMEGAGENVKKYVVTVGDVCFVAVGQITGRGYQAVRYQPTGITIINSPTHDPLLAKAVRALHPLGENPERALLDSLLTDYFTEGTFNGENLDGWMVGSDLQTAAVRRLLFYFPDETALLVAARLQRMDVARPQPDDAGGTKWMQREVANGVRAMDFLPAVAWCGHPAIRQAITEIIRRTDDPEVLIAASPGVRPENAAMFREKLEAQLAALPKVEGYGVSSQDLLTLLGAKCGAEAEPAFLAYAKEAGVQRRVTLCIVLREIRQPWGIDLLRPFLEDQSVGPESGIPDDAPKKRLLLRVCDSAATTINAIRPELKFTFSVSSTRLDEQIKEIARQLDAGNK